MKSMTRKLDIMHEDNAEALIKVAFATTDRKQVNQHFGSARCFAIYGIFEDSWSLFSVTQFGDLSQDGNEDKLAVKLKVLEGCSAVFCRACGASGVKQLLASGIQPIKVSEGSLIQEIVKSLQQEMQGQPSPWLAKVLAKRNKQDDSRFDQMAVEGWVD